MWYIWSQLKITFRKSSGLPWKNLKNSEIASPPLFAKIDNIFVWIQLFQHGVYYLVEGWNVHTCFEEFVTSVQNGHHHHTEGPVTPDTHTASEFNARNTHRFKQKSYNILARYLASYIKLRLVCYYC